MGLFDSIGDALGKANDAVTRFEGKAESAPYTAAASVARAFGANGVAAQLDHVADQVADAHGADVAERELGDTDDPRELIHGDPAAIGHVHDLLQQMGDSIEKTGDALRKIDLSDWIGEAARGFHTEFEKQPKLWWTGADAMHKAAGILDTWGHAVAAAQGRAADALAKWNQAAAEEFSRKTAWNALSADQRKSTPLVDTWTAMRHDAREILRGARTDRDAAASTAASGLKAATATAPDTPPLSQRLLDDVDDTYSALNDAGAHFTKGLITSFTGIEQFVRQLDPYETYNMTHPAQYLQGMADLGTGLVIATADPGATVDSFLKDTRKDPSEFLGSLTGNTLMTVGTGGAGAAKPALTAVEEAADATKAAQVAGNTAEHTAPHPGTDSPHIAELPKPAAGESVPTPKSDPPIQRSTHDAGTAPAQPAARPSTESPQPVSDTPTSRAQPTAHISDAPRTTAPTADISPAPAQPAAHTAEASPAPAQPAAHTAEAPSPPAQPAPHSSADTPAAHPTVHTSGPDAAHARLAGPHDQAPANQGSGVSGTHPFAPSSNPVAAQGTTLEHSALHPVDATAPQPDAGSSLHGLGSRTEPVHPGPAPQLREVTSSRPDDVWQNSSRPETGRPSPHPDAVVPDAGRPAAARPEQVSPTGRDPVRWDRPEPAHRAEPADPYRSADPPGGSIESASRPAEPRTPPAERSARPIEPTERAIDRTARPPEYPARTVEPPARPQDPYRPGDSSPATSSARASWDNSPRDHPAARPGSEHALRDTSPGAGVRPEPPMRPVDPDRAPAPREPVENRPEIRRTEHPDTGQMNAEHPEPVSSGHGAPPNRPAGPRPNLRDLFPPDGFQVDKATSLPQFQQAMGGEYGGLHVRVNHIYGDYQAVHVEMKIFDADGMRVGHATRTFENRAGHLSAHHANLVLQKSVQGQGFATEMNNAMFAWYRDSGVEEVLLRANIDVGSYAWARQGFEFQNGEEAARTIRPRLGNEIRREQMNLDQLRLEVATAPNGPEKIALQKKIRDVEQVIKDAKTLHKNFEVGSPHFTTPKQITELGRPVGIPPEQLRKMTWLGKNVFLDPVENISWHGIKRMNAE
ncbi:putative T7SS-secreted protein [Nocardia aurantia]|uniref:Putative T7SS secretion signal domain-containing protein n=1 Tax=Nocardia aurantia TaxID=2585199 RepID=A0A7K0E2T8_9NOCA|nr:hypothetical protein [Nocardia aurantia]MQY31464.1 hypothetical protein [Nocardia aurantia]